MSYQTDITNKFHFPPTQPFYNSSNKQIVTIVNMDISDLSSDELSSVEPGCLDSEFSMDVDTSESGDDNEADDIESEATIKAAAALTAITASSTIVSA